MFKEIVRRAKSDSLLHDSAIIFGASMIVNVLNYVFQLYVGRTLGPYDYGVFASVVSLLYILAVPCGTINLCVANFVSGFKGKKELGKVKYLFFRGFRKVVFFGSLGFLIVASLSGHISSFLNIENTMPIVILGMIFFVSMIDPIGTGTLLGLQRFKKLGFVQIVNSSLKLSFGVGLLALGYGVNGALSSLFLAGLFGFGFVLFFLRDVLLREAETFGKEKILSYSFPVFISLLLIAFMSNIDIVLVKHYFPGAAAGHYAAAALLGKVVLFASSAVSGVMFAKVSELRAVGKPTAKLLYESIFYVFCISFAVVVVYFIAPHFVLNLLFGSSYIDAVPLIGLFGLAMGFFALSSALVQYNLAIRDMKFVYVIFASVLIEVIMISLFHDSLLTVVKILTGTMVLTFSSMMIITKKEIIG